MSVYQDKKAKVYTYDFWFKNRRYKNVTEATSKEAALKIEKAAREQARVEFALGKPTGNNAPMPFEAATARYNHEVAQHLAGQGPEIVLRDLERLEDWVEKNVGPNSLLTDITDDNI